MAAASLCTVAAGSPSALRLMSGRGLNGSARASAAVRNLPCASALRTRHPLPPTPHRPSPRAHASAASEYPKEPGTDGVKVGSKETSEQEKCQTSNGAEVKTEEEAPKGWWNKTKAWFKSPKGLSKEKLLKMGTSALLSYGFVSNINAITLMIIAWNMFTAKTGLSPFAAGQWAPYLLTYAALYATFGNLLRPFRLMLAAALSPVFDRIVKKIGATFNVKPPIAMGLTVFFVNFCGTLSYLALGLFLTSLFTGMPILPA